MVLTIVPICFIANISLVIVGISDHCEPKQIPTSIEPTYRFPEKPEAIIMWPIVIMARVIIMSNGLAHPLVSNKRSDKHSAPKRPSKFHILHKDTKKLISFVE